MSNFDLSVLNGFEDLSGSDSDDPIRPQQKRQTIALTSATVSSRPMNRFQVTSATHNTPSLENNDAQSLRREKSSQATSSDGNQKFQSKARRQLSKPSSRERANLRYLL